MSNQEAIALLRNLEDSLDSYCELSEEGKTAFRMAIEALSSSEFPNSSDTDCIRRQAAIDALRTCYDTETITMDNGDEYINYGDAVGEIEQLPPIQPEPSQVARDISRIIENEKDMRIQPKKGRWILDRSGAYCCSECMEPCAGYVMMKPRDKYCKMCGSRNEVTE